MTDSALVDSHCHLDRLPGVQGVEGVAPFLEEAQQAGVRHVVCVGTDGPSSTRAVELATRHAMVSASVGVHPHDVDAPCDWDTLCSQAQHDRVVAIGETGLDCHRGTETQAAQEASFRRHIQLARAVGKPLIIHTRSAAERTLALLREQGADAVGGVFHCFTESWEVAEQAMTLGFLISFSGIVTFQNARALQAVAQRVPMDRMLVETDAPYLAPHPHRGQPNRPAHVRVVAEQVARLRQITLDAVITATTANFQRVFAPASM